MKQRWSAGIPPATSQNAPESAFGDLLEVSFKTVAGEGGLKKADVQGDGPSKEDKDEKGLNVACTMAYLMEDPQAMGLVAADMAGLTAQTLPKDDGVLTDQTMKGRAASIVLNQGAGQAASDAANLKAAGMHGKVQEQVLKTSLNAQVGEQVAPPGRSSVDVLQASKADKAQNISEVQAQAADKIPQVKELDAANQDGLQKRSGEFQDHLENARIKVLDDKPGEDKAHSSSMSPAVFGLEHRSEQLQRTEGAQAAAQELPLDTSGEDGAAKQVGKATLRALHDGASEYRIQLHPEGLGRVEVTLVAQHKMISLSMRTDNELARALILDHAGDLRAEMNTQDYQLGALDVHVGTDSQNSAGFMASFGDQARQGIEARRGDSGHDAQSAQTQAASQEIRRRYVSNNVINYRI